MIQTYSAAEIKVLNSVALTSALNQIAQNFDRLWPYRRHQKAHAEWRNRRCN